MGNELGNVLQPWNDSALFGHRSGTAMPVQCLQEKLDT